MPFSVRPSSRSNDSSVPFHARRANSCLPWCCGRFTSTDTGTPAQLGNNQSLVLRLSYGQRRVLLAGDIEHQAEREAALRRLLDHYLHTAHTAAVLLYPRWGPITLAPPQAGVTPEKLV